MAKKKRGLSKRKQPDILREIIRECMINRAMQSDCDIIYKIGAIDQITKDIRSEGKNLIGERAFVDRLASLIRAQEIYSDV